LILRHTFKMAAMTSFLSNPPAVACVRRLPASRPSMCDVVLVVMYVKQKRAAVDIFVFILRVFLFLADSRFIVGYTFY